jgi:hypothetical protein
MTPSSSPHVRPLVQLWLYPSGKLPSTNHGTRVRCVAGAGAKGQGTHKSLGTLQGGHSIEEHSGASMQGVPNAAEGDQQSITKNTREHAKKRYHSWYARSMTIVVDNPAELD